MTNDYKEDFSRFLVRSGALSFGDFVTKSGRKTPYFINTGKFTTAQQITKLGQYYAACIQEHRHEKEYDMIYGPAYKGIPLVISTAMALYEDFHVDIPFAFNRKEPKDHGEGGNLIGHLPQEGDRVIIVEDVITAGTSVRESIPLLQAAASVNITTLIIAVDRMERGQGERTAIEEIREAFSIETFSIVTIAEVVNFLHDRPVEGHVYIDDNMKEKIERHLAENGIR